MLILDTRGLVPANEGYCTTNKHPPTRIYAPNCRIAGHIILESSDPLWFYELPVNVHKKWVLFPASESIPISRRVLQVKRKRRG